MSIVDDIRSLASDAESDPRPRFASPMQIAEAQDAPYEARLRLLQRWRSLAVRDHGQGSAEEAAARDAVTALESGAKLDQDRPEGAPDSTYGAVRREDQ